MIRAGLGQPIERGAERHTQIGAGISVGNRENVDTVQRFLFEQYTMDAGPERGRKNAGRQPVLRIRRSNQRGGR